MTTQARGNERGGESYSQMFASDDHGRTWSYWLTGAIGKIGNYGTRIQFNALGDSPHRVYEMRVAAKTKVNISNAYLDVRTGTY